MTEIRFLQTTDPDDYYELFSITAEINRLFCRYQEVAYNGYIGIRVGRHPWHATFNRIPLLKEMVSEGYRGWVIYADADAYVADVKFPIRTFLEQRKGRSLLAAPGGAALWAVNAGILLFNLGSDRARCIIEKWSERFAFEVDIGQLNRAVAPWHEGILDDQALLHRVLSAEDDLEVILELLPFEILGNHDSGFLRQLLRSRGSMTDRILAARSDVARILNTLHAEDGSPQLTSMLSVGPTALRTSSTPPADAQMNLTALADRHGSDKGTRWGGRHRYTLLYDLVFNHIRDQPLKLLELGLAQGGPEVGGDLERRVPSPSLSMWLEFFPTAQIIGFDISDFSHLQHERFLFVQGDSGSVEDLTRLTEASARFDIIIDDASHASYHQQLAFRTLFPKLASGGFYIIEDLHWQSPYFEPHLPQTQRTGVLFDAFFSKLEFLPNPVLTETELTAIARELASYACFPSFNLDDETRGPKLLVMRKR